MQRQRVRARGVVVLVPVPEGRRPSMRRISAVMSLGVRRPLRSVAPASVRRTQSRRRRIDSSVSCTVFAVSVARSRKPQACRASGRSPQRVLGEQRRETRGSGPRSIALGLRERPLHAPRVTRTPSACSCKSGRRQAAQTGGAARRAGLDRPPRSGAQPIAWRARVRRAARCGGSARTAEPGCAPGARAVRAADSRASAAGEVTPHPPVGRERVEVEPEPLLQLADAQPQDHVERIKLDRPPVASRAPRRSDARVPDGRPPRTRAAGRAA